MTPRVSFRTFGAQLTQIDHSDILYLSPLGRSFNKSWRGGQPVIFPQFADRGPLKKHGFARDIDWSIVAEERVSSRHRVILAKDFNPENVSDWPYEARLILDVEYMSGHIRQSLEIMNVGRGSFQWSGGLHPYFSVDSLLKARLKGLDGVNYSDRYLPDEALVGTDYLSWDDDPCEKLFEGAPDLVLETGSTTISLKASGFDQWMVWNPGREGAHQIDDLPDEDWDKFVCIEPVCVNRPVVLIPGERFFGQFEISFNHA